MNYKEKIKQLADILESIDDTVFIQALQCFRGDCEYIESERDAKDLARNIKRGYAGMGSFNDLSISDAFVRLQSELFDVCVDIITRPREKL